MDKAIRYMEQRNKILQELKPGILKIQYLLRIEAEEQCSKKTRRNHTRASTGVGHHARE